MVNLAISFVVAYVLGAVDRVANDLAAEPMKPMGFPATHCFMGLPWPARPPAAACCVSHDNGLGFLQRLWAQGSLRKDCDQVVSPQFQWSPFPRSSWAKTLGLSRAVAARSLRGSRVRVASRMSIPHPT